MSGGLALTLVGLALVDSTSIGTLFIPVWLLMAPGRIAVGRFLGYLATIAGFYFVVGNVLLLAGGELAAALDGSAATRWLLVAQLVAGLVLFALAFRVGSRKGGGTAVVLRWRDRASTGATGAGSLAGLALLAAVAEIATMLPYLGAIGLLTTAELGRGTVVLVLAAYCVVMVLPALALLAGRVAGSSRVERVLERTNRWATERGGSAAGWVLGVVGFLVGRDAAARLWFPQLLGGG